MSTLSALASTALGALAFASGVGAATPPARDSFSFRDQFVDTDTCGFPVAGDVAFTNEITEWFDGGVIATLHLRQSTVGTLTANGTTLRVNNRETIVVELVDGVAVTAKHVGLLNSIVGPGGPVFLRTGQALFKVVGGLDGPLIARHGLRDVFDPAEFCAAFE